MYDHRRDSGKNIEIKNDGMDTILGQLRRLHMEETVSADTDTKTDNEDSSSGPKLTGVYRCRACGYIFDESIEGKPFSTLKECPLCHVSPGGFMKLR